MTISTMKDGAYEVSDPSDWQGTPLASLSQVEYSLRCHVCKDFFNSPMTTSCSHTFCSLCIRRALNTDAKCPLCRTVDQESKLRANNAIREVVDTFTTARDAMLQFARQPPLAAPAATPKRKAEEEEANEESAPKRTRMSTRSSSARATRAAAAMLADDAEIPQAREKEEEYIPGRSFSQDTHKVTRYPLIRKTDDGLVPCPICEWRMEPQKVDRHLDTTCPGEPCAQPVLPKPFAFSTARHAASTSAHTYERLPALNYAILTETKLRRKLVDTGIPAGGTKLAMERRYKEWAMMWNANCDSTRPKTKQELLRDLDVWERTQGSLAPPSSAALNQGAQIKDKNFDGAGWSTRHNDSFKDLIANARKSQQAKKAVAQPTPSEEAEPAVTPPLQETRAISLLDETKGTSEQDANGTPDKAFPLLAPQPETRPIENSVPIHATGPSRERPSGESVFPNHS